MAIALDSKDLAVLDQKLVASSQVWEVLIFYSKLRKLSEKDFEGVNSVNVDKISGMTPTTQYKRGQQNGADSVVVEKELRKLKQERYKAFTFDKLDLNENASYTIMNVVEQFRSEIAIPEKDTAAMNEIYIAGKAGGKSVDVALTKTNILEEIDKVEAHFLANGKPFDGVLFMTASTYTLLKNADKISRGLRLDDKTRVQGLDRTITLLDGKIPVQVVADARMVNADTGSNPVNFIFVGNTVSNCVEKFNDMEIVFSESNTGGFIDTAKTLNYYDNIILDNQKENIYICREA